jgi:hypothetical protein
VDSFVNLTGCCYLERVVSSDEPDQSNYQSHRRRRDHWSPLILFCYAFTTMFLLLRIDQAEIEESDID